MVVPPGEMHRGGAHRRRRPRRGLCGQLPHHLHHPLRPAAPGGEHPPARGHRGGPRPRRCPRTSTPSAPAIKKEYTYRIYNSRIWATPFYVDRAWFYPKHLDADSDAAGRPTSFVGTHDFAGGPLGGHRDEDHRPHGPLLRHGPRPAADLIECRVCADGFLYNMVRAMVGTVRLRRRGQARPGRHPRHPGVRATAPSPDPPCPPGGCT